jgi:hypothetical protein
MYCERPHPDEEERKRADELGNEAPSPVLAHAAER